MKFKYLCRFSCLLYNKKAKLLWGSFCNSTLREKFRSFQNNKHTYSLMIIRGNRSSSYCYKSFFIICYLNLYRFRYKTSVSTIEVLPGAAD